MAPWSQEAECMCACAQDESLLMSLVQRHLKYTGSTVARALLNNWSMARAAFVKVFPPEYRHALEQQAAARVRPL